MFGVSYYYIICMPELLLDTLCVSVYVYVRVMRDSASMCLSVCFCVYMHKNL